MSVPSSARLGRLALPRAMPPERSPSMRRHMRVSVELDRRSAFSPLAIVSDLFLLAGFAAVIYGLALWSLPVAFVVAGLILFGAGIVGTVLTLKSSSSLDRGPFDPGTAGRSQ